LQGTVVTLKLTAGALVIGLAIGLPLSLAAGLRSEADPAGLQCLSDCVQGHTAAGAAVCGVLRSAGNRAVLFPHGSSLHHPGMQLRAYQCEYFRGAIQAVSRGQMQAARGIGMSRFQGIRYIVLPQALRLVIPAWSNELIAMVKYTAIVFLIAVPDLMNKAKILSSQNFAPIQTYLLVALIYLVLVGFLSLVLHGIQRKLAVPGLDAGMDGR
jgi:polar amino acid transport system permease protein